MEAPPTRMRSHHSEIGSWEMVSRAPHPALRSYVRSYEGYAEHELSFRARLEVPHPGVVLILTFGPRLRSLYQGCRARSVEHGSFIAGMHDAYVLVEQVGPSNGVQINLTPLGAYAILGVHMSELTNRSVDAADVLGAAADALVEQMREAPCWDERMAIIDQFIFQRLAAAHMPSEGVAWAWHRLQSTGGSAPISSLAETLGCSQKHLISQFREQVGLAPKMAARVVRFNRAVGMLQRAERPRFADIAADCGYYDQAHFTREFTAFAGRAPGDFASRLLPGEGGVLGDSR